MNEQNIPQSNESVQSSKHIWITIIAVIVTAIIIGGGVCVWQKSSLQSTEKSLQRQITDLQKQIENLQQTTSPVVTTTEVTQNPMQTSKKFYKLFYYSNLVSNRYLIKPT